MLHTLRCVGFAALSRLADAAGATESEAESELIDLAVAGLVRREHGCWGLTDAGRAAAPERAAALCAGHRAAITAGYQRFLPLNPELLDLCTAWQLRVDGGVAVDNDHTDEAYDARVLDRIADLHGRVTPVCADLAAALPRFGRYPHRLAAALGRARAGRLEYVADTLDSYHAVWFQLHEDLLVTLGIPR